MKKKLQVFISSTFLDLQDERQAAVEAVLNSKNIPAGMELFRASNESQWDTIKKWIDESDIYMLMLGGRYGSIEKQSGKSYTELEYDYAVANNKPLFSIILSDKFLDTKKQISSNAMETENIGLYNLFKEKVKDKMVAFVDDCKDIVIQVNNSINGLKEDNDFTGKGWVRGGEDVELLRQELESLKDENRKLLVKIDTMSNKKIDDFLDEDTEFLDNTSIPIKIKCMDEFFEKEDKLKLPWYKVIRYVLRGVLSSKTNRELKYYIEVILNDEHIKQKSIIVTMSWFEEVKLKLLKHKLIEFTEENGTKKIKITERGQNYIFRDDKL